MERGFSLTTLTTPTKAACSEFVAAGKLAGISPDHARRWLDKPAVRALLRAERRTYREALCAGNEHALRKVRDQSENAMAVCAAVRTLENIAVEAEARSPSQQERPGLVVIIQQPSPVALQPVRTIDAALPPAIDEPASVPREPRCRIGYLPPAHRCGRHMIGSPRMI
jgi:hypothetical protein